jgi:5'-3' exonuclease
VAFDGARVFRHKLLSTYKGSRRKDKEERLIPDGAVEEGSPYLLLPALLAYLGEHGIPNVQHDLYEADDVLASVAAQTKGAAVLGSKDKDIYQCLGNGTLQFDSSGKKNGERCPIVIDALAVEKKLGVKASQAVDYQTLIGDGIDDVPRIMSPAKASLGLKTYGTIQEWAAADEEVRKLFKARRAELNLNRKLVRLVTDIKISLSPIRWAVPSGKTPKAYIALRDFCNPKTKGLFGGVTRQQR